MLNQHSDDLRILRCQLVAEWRGVDFDQLDRVQAELYRRASNTCRAIRLELERRESAKGSYESFTGST